MYSRCSTCEAVFEVTESLLAAEQGLARCGCCGDVFNASWNLVDVAVDSADPPATARVAGTTLTANAGQPAPFEDWDMPVLDRLVRIGANSTEPTPGSALAEPSGTLVAPSAAPPAGTTIDSAPPEHSAEHSFRTALTAGDGPIAGRESADQSTSPQARTTTDIYLETIADDARHTEQSPSLHADRREALSTEPAGGKADWNRVREPRLAPLAESGVNAASEARSPVIDDGRRAPDDVRPEPLTQSTARPAAARATQRSRIAWQSQQRENPVTRSLWVLGCLLLIVLLLAQVKLSFVPQLAQFAPLRPILTSFCGIAGCQLPYRRDLNRLTLGRTQVTLHPQVPGAVRVSVRVTNRAPFDQPLPTVQLTLTDRAGRIVGRRAYRPGAYGVAAGSPMKFLAAGASTEIVLDLAQPNDNAVSYQLDTLR